MEYKSKKKYVLTKNVRSKSLRPNIHSINFGRSLFFTLSLNQLR